MTKNAKYFGDFLHCNEISYDIFKLSATIWCTGHFLIYLIATDNKGQACSSVTKVKPLHSEKYESVPITFFACLISDYNLQLRPKK